MAYLSKLFQPRPGEAASCFSKTMQPGSHSPGPDIWSFWGELRIAPVVILTLSSADNTSVAKDLIESWESDEH